MIGVMTYRLVFDANGASGAQNPEGINFAFQRENRPHRFPERRWFGRYAWTNNVWPWGGTYYVHGTLVLLITLPLLVVSIRSFRPMRREGHCVCGYDLRATPERCPECGRNVSQVST